MARVNNRKTLGILLDITLLILIVYMVVFLFNKVNEFAREEKHYEVWPPGSISDDVVEQLLRKPAN
tara:strand:+ start:313 stop:510 length:198 start_codon:yes stop_codon:yes gene_type:complete